MISPSVITLITNAIQNEVPCRKAVLERNNNVSFILKCYDIDLHIGANNECKLII
jgi:hypothetical protein